MATLSAISFCSLVLYNILLPHSLYQSHRGDTRVPSMTLPVLIDGFNTHSNLRLAGADAMVTTLLQENRSPKNHLSESRLSRECLKT